MICTNCGASYEANLLECPFCQTKNQEGKRRAGIRAEQDHAYKNKKEAVLQSGRPEIVIRILNRMIVISAGLILLNIVGIFAFFFVAGGINQLLGDKSKDYSIELSDMRDAGQYGDIYMFKKIHDLDGTEDAIEYHEISSMFFHMVDFREGIDEMTRYSREEILEDKYIIKLMLGNAYDIVIDRTSYVRGEVYEENQEIYDSYTQEVKLQLMLNCYLTAEEIDELFVEDRHNYDEFVSIIKERMISHGKNE